MHEDDFLFFFSILLFFFSSIINIPVFWLSNYSFNLAFTHFASKIYSSYSLNFIGQGGKVNITNVFFKKFSEKDYKYRYIFIKRFAL